MPRRWGISVIAVMPPDCHRRRAPGAAAVTGDAKAVSEDRLGLPRLDDIEPAPDVATGPTTDSLGLPDAAQVAHKPSLAGIEHLVDPSKPRPQRPNQ